MFYFIFYYVLLLLVVILFCYVEYHDKKRRAQDAIKLQNDFDEWVTSQGKSQKPSNALFVELYRICYKEDAYPFKVYTGNSVLVKVDTVDVVASFPSLHKQLLPTQFSLLSNLESYFSLQYERSTSVVYYIRFIITIPGHILKYFGLDDQRTASKILKALIWILSLFFPPLKELVLSFIDFMLHR